MNYLVAFCIALLSSVKAFANPACPVCMVTVGAAAYIAEKSGLDKCVIGVWSGALLAIFGYFLIRWFNKKGWNFPFKDIVLMLLSIGSIGFMYLGYFEYQPIIIGFLYIDSFLFSNIMGAIIFITGVHFYEWLKRKNGGHAHFPFEKVFIPVVLTGLLSALFYFYPVCNCNTAFEEMNGILPVLD